MKNRKAFTLVELIVVITILAILGTIAFVSMQGYSASSRDSIRATDARTIDSALNIYLVDVGTLPSVTAGSDITYSGRKVWTQGTFGLTTVTNLTNMTEVPVDPLTEKKYSYSVNSTNNQFEISTLFESDMMVLDSKLSPEVYAGDRIARAYVIGSYNGRIIKVQDGTNVFVLALPSLMSSIDDTLENIITNDGLVYNGYNNLSFNYTSSQYNVNGESNLKLVNGASMEVFHGALSDLSLRSNQITLIDNLQAAYTGTTTASMVNFKTLFDLDTVNDENKAVFIAQNLLNSYIDKKINIDN